MFLLLMVLSLKVLIRTRRQKNELLNQWRGWILIFLSAIFLFAKPVSVFLCFKVSSSYCCSAIFKNRSKDNFLVLFFMRAINSGSNRPFASSYTSIGAPGKIISL